MRCGAGRARPTSGWLPAVQEGPAVGGCAVTLLGKLVTLVLPMQTQTFSLLEQFRSSLSPRTAAIFFGRAPVLQCHFLAPVQTPRPAGTESHPAGADFLASASDLWAFPVQIPDADSCKMLLWPPGLQLDSRGSCHRIQALSWVLWVSRSLDLSYSTAFDFLDVHYKIVL